LAEGWWDPKGSMAPLHRLNPARLGFLRQALATHFDRDSKGLRPFEGLRLLDIGCGGGLISEPLARLGADVTGIDASGANVAIAGAEYIMGWLPRGTHRWDRFLRPSELAAALRRQGLQMREIRGLVYDLPAGDWRIGRDLGVNYLAFATRPTE